MCSSSFIYYINAHKRTSRRIVHERSLNVQFIYIPKCRSIWVGVINNIHNLYKKPNSFLAGKIQTGYGVMVKRKYLVGTMTRMIDTYYSIHGTTRLMRYFVWRACICRIPVTSNWAVETLNCRDIIVHDVNCELCNQVRN